jgi:hypothetical protein
MLIRFAAALLGIGAGIYAFTNVGEATPDVRHPGIVNPLGIFYDKTLEGVEQYQRPTALLVSGNCNRDDPRFSQARAAGAEVLAYINPTAVYDVLPCRSQDSLYGPDRERVPLWPFPDYGERVSWKNTHMTDIRVGSPWSNHVVDYVEKLMRDGKVDGVFLDVVGARLWSSTTSWKSWSDKEQDAWTDGNIDLVRRIDARRRAINPDFIVVNNSFWERGDPRGLEGARYVDGIVLEHPKLNDFEKRNAQRPYGDLGHRRVLVIAREGEAQAWAQVPGVTHVGDQKTYGHPGPPPVPFSALMDRVRRAGSLGSK